MLIRRPSLVTVDIFYYRPNSLLLQEFIWQTDDLIPDIPRVHKFLRFWKANIEAKINQVLVMSECRSFYRSIDQVIKVH